MLRHTTCLFQWSKTEDLILQQLMKEDDFEAKWSELSLLIFERAGNCLLRTCKDIRERWKNYLDPTLKRNYWTQEQDDIIINLTETHGRKWSFIAKAITGRTQNQVKNRFITLFKKRRIMIGPRASRDQNQFPEQAMKNELLNQGSGSFEETFTPNSELYLTNKNQLNNEDHIFIEKVFQKQPTYFFSDFTQF